VQELAGYCAALRRNAGDCGESQGLRAGCSIEALAADLLDDFKQMAYVDPGPRNGRA